MTGRNKEELNGVTLLGSQKNKYPSDYAPEMLETFPKMTILSSSTARSSPACAR